MDIRNEAIIMVYQDGAIEIETEPKNFTKKEDLER